MLGGALIAELNAAQHYAVAVKPERDKKTRMALQSIKFEKGLVFLPKGAPWLAELEVELFIFPNSAYDDQIDSISQALAYGGKVSMWDDKALEGYNRFVSKLCGF
jgi:predicted phage terminase large subunit-like protein